MRQIPKTPNRMGPQVEPLRVKYSFEPDSKTEHECPADEEVSDLHPPLPAKTERADSIVPGAVVRASGSFDENTTMKSGGPIAPQAEQESDRQRPLSNFFLLFLP